jgi:sugar (pentulose or hexulose) kinase
VSDWLLGIDAGLTNVKAAVYDGTGAERSVAVDSPAAADSTPAPDHEERDLRALWDVVTGVVREAIDGAPVASDAIDGVGVTAHGHGLYALDAAGDPVRPGIKSTDSRATGVRAEWAERGLLEVVESIAGYRPFAGDPLSLLAWLKREEPDAYGDIETVLFCKDYLKYRLSGEVCTDEMEASVFADVETGAYSRELLERLGIAEVADALPPVVDSWEACGEVTPEAAEATGLAAGTPVASGLHDVGATALGAGVSRPGEAMLIVGTWGQSIVIRDDPRAAGEAIPRRFLGDAWLVYRGNRSAATCVDWFTDRFGDEWERQAEAEGVSPYEVYDRTVASAPAGADGLLFHPFLHGSTTRPTARAGFYGLAESHTAAHMLRAVYEGVAIAQAEGVRAIEDPATLSTVRLGGGGARSDVWAGIFADVLAERVSVADGSEMGARGAAICAALAAGVHPSHAAAVDAMVGVDRTYDPDPGTAETYRHVQEAFRETLDRIEPTWDRLAALRDRAAPTDDATATDADSDTDTDPR